MFGQREHSPTLKCTHSAEQTISYFAAVGGHTDLAFYAYWFGSAIDMRFADCPCSRARYTLRRVCKLMTVTTDATTVLQHTQAGKHVNNHAHSLSAKDFLDAMVSRVPNFRGIKYTTVCEGIWSSAWW